MKLTELIIGNSYKVLLDKSLFVNIKRPVNFLWVVEILATFNL